MIYTDLQNEDGMNNPKNIYMVLIFVMVSEWY